MKINELLIKNTTHSSEADLLKDRMIDYVDKVLGRESSKLDRELLQKKLSLDFLEIGNALKHMSKSEITEIFRPTSNWQWTVQESDYAEAMFSVDKIPYIIKFVKATAGTWATWDVEFEVDPEQTHDVPLDKRYKITGTGNSAEVFSTVTDIIKSFLRDYDNTVEKLAFMASEPSRKSLYNAMIRRLLPNWEVTVTGPNFEVGRPGLVERQNISEIFNPRKSWKWTLWSEKKAIAEFEVGNLIYIVTIDGEEYKHLGPGTWLIEFASVDKTGIGRYRYDITGTGNSVQVFSAVVGIIKSFMEQHDNISTIVFSAEENSRKKLYAAMIHRIFPDWEVKVKGRYFYVTDPRSLTESINRVPISTTDFDNLSDIMSRPIPAAVASAYIQEIIDDDELTDNLDILAEQQPSSDVRPIIADWFRRVMPDQLYRFIGPDRHNTDGKLSPLHGYDAGSHKGTNDPITGNAFGRI